MIQKFIDEKYNFITLFNPETGSYVRTGILNEAGYDSGVDPFQCERDLQRGFLGLWKPRHSRSKESYIIQFAWKHGMTLKKLKPHGS